MSVKSSWSPLKFFAYFHFRKSNVNGWYIEIPHYYCARTYVFFNAFDVCFMEFGNSNMLHKIYIFWWVVPFNWYIVSLILIVFLHLVYGFPFSWWFDICLCYLVWRQHITYVLIQSIHLYLLSNELTLFIFKVIIGVDICYFFKFVKWCFVLLYYW